MPTAATKKTASSQARTAGRPRRFTYEQIVQAALDVMDNEGYAALTISSLAKHMKVSHSVLYKYVGNIEELEVEALQRLAAAIPMPRPGTPQQIRQQTIDCLMALRQILLKHPGVLYVPAGSRARDTFTESVVQWVLALTPFAIDAEAASIGHAALVNMVAQSAETERHLGPHYAAEAQRTRDKRLPRIRSPQFVLEHLIDSLFPGFRKSL